MITVGMITECLNSHFPPQQKESWDRVGLNCGHLSAPVTKVLVALDPFGDVCREAKDWGAQMIVTHHTLLWDLFSFFCALPIGSIRLFPCKAASVMRLPLS